MPRTTAILLGSSALLCLPLLAGCQGGHGKYTGAFKEEAEQRMAALKSGTEWDLAQQQYHAGDLERALDSVERSLALNPDVPKSHVLRGKILIEMARMESALGAFDNALELDNEFVEAHYYKGLIYERFRRPQEALVSYRRAYELDSSDPQYLVAAAEMLIESGQIDAARELMTAEADRFQFNAGVQQQLGHIAMIEGDTARAIELFEEAVLLSSNDPSVLEDLARAQIKGQRYADAEYSLGRLIEEEQLEGRVRRDLLHLRARCLVEMDRLLEARQILTELAREAGGSSDAETWRLLGEVAIGMGDTYRLREAANRLISIDPDGFSGYLLLAWWQRMTNAPDAALRTLDRAIAAGPDNAEPYTLRSLILAKAGRDGEALEAAMNGLKLEPQNERLQRLYNGLSARLTANPASGG
ncbi:MAG: tetratricopeptide repeat protein [Planctomycetota bacterium]